MYKAVALTSIAALAGQSMALNAHRHQMDKKALVVDWTTVIDTVYVTVDPNAAAATPAPAAATSAAGGFAAQDVPNPTGPAAGNAAAAASSSAAAAVASSSAAAAAPAAQPTTLVTSVRPTVPVVVSSSSAAAPVVASSAPVTSAAAPPATSEKPTPTPTPSSSSAPAPAPSSTSQAAAPSATPSKAPSKAPSSAPVAAGHFGRGMAYNDGVLANAYGALSGKMGWAYNWGFYPSGIDSQFSYIPTLWSTDPSHSTGFAAQVETLIAAGSKAIFSFNEPDIASQANMSPSEAASAHQQWLNQYSGKVQIGAPAVSNSGSANQGADWLKQWVAACAGNCAFDFVNMHWYNSASAIDDFFNQIEAISTAGGGKPVMITEFQPSGTSQEVQAFLEEALPKLDANPNVMGYSYFMVANSGSADGMNLMASDSVASNIGLTYAST
ncbi:hypothetical protein ACQKWADRAFT_291084 [Trichoderma austrokoningii]